MWMVSYNEGGELNTVGLDHSFSGRKLRPLMPRPMTSPPNNNASTTTTTTPSLNHIHGNDFFSQYHYYHHLVGEHSKQCNASPVVVSSRWNPTPEQLRALEELYRRGTRTPSADQIQHITAQLRRFGKIEGKNVFYWFQNHKARERQKRRRQMGFDHSPEKKDLLGAASKTVFEVEEIKNLAPSTNCSTHAEESVSIQRRARAVVAGCSTDGWLQFDEGELQQRRNFLERNATWQMMQQLLPCPPPAPAATHLINTPPNTSAASCSMATTISATTTTVSTRIMDPSLIKTHDLSFFPIPPQRENGVVHLFSNSSPEDDNCVESQTLQLFPLGSSGDGSSSDRNINYKETEISASAINANYTPSHEFFEFLPLKN